VKLSISIPAFNEEKLITGCVQKVHEALKTNAASDLTSEIIVVDNNSIDGTAQFARAAGAQVVFEPINQISRARNAGAAAAQGDWLLFVDADSWLSPVTVAELLACIRQGRSAGGGCVVDLDEAPLLGKFFIETWNLISRTLKWAAGCFVFCRTDIFREIGGFPAELYAAEEIRFSVELHRVAKKRRLKVVILQKQRHVSSGRKFKLYSRGEMFQHILGALVNPNVLRDRKKLFWFYDGRR
jgi:glycosyltransferase involved in cell wall biosynthesis